MPVRVFFSAKLSGKQLNLLKNHGFEVVPIPLIRAVPIDFSKGDVLTFSPEFVVISSKNGVKHLFSRISPENFRNATFIAVGRATAERLKRLGIEPLIPENFSGEGVVKAIESWDLRDKKFLIVKPKFARKLVPEFLKERGAKVKEVAVYETVTDESIKEKLNKEMGKGFDIAVFTSPSNFKSFLTISGDRGKNLLKRGKIVAIGHVTKKAIERLGFKVWKVPKEYTIDAIVNLIIQGGKDDNWKVSTVEA